MAAVSDHHFIEIDTLDDRDRIPDCAVASCGYSLLDALAGKKTRRLFRQVGGVDDGLTLCEACMSPGDLAVLKGGVR